MDFTLIIQYLCITIFQTTLKETSKTNNKIKWKNIHENIFYCFLKRKKQKKTVQKLTNIPKVNGLKTSSIVAMILFPSIVIYLLSCRPSTIFLFGVPRTKMWYLWIIDADVWFVIGKTIVSQHKNCRWGSSCLANVGESSNGKKRLGFRVLMDTLYTLLRKCLIVKKRKENRLPLRNKDTNYYSLMIQQTLPPSIWVW